MSVASNLNLAGKRVTGNTVRTQNGNYKIENSYCRFLAILLHMFLFLLVLAASSIANIVKSSLGPVGLDKMLVDDVGVRFAS